MIAKIHKDNYDIKEPEKTSSSGTLGLDLCKAIAHKGFCILPSGITNDDLFRARQEIKELNTEGRFHRPAPQLEPGLFGKEGSAYMAEVKAPEESMDGDTLKSIDEKMSDIASETALWCEDMLDFKVVERTLSWLHRWEENPEEDEGEMTEEMASKWINCFARSALMCLTVLGPKGGSFALTPFDGESETIEVAAEPGTMLVIRTDALAHEYLSRDGEYVMACWFLQENLAGIRSSYNAGLEKGAYHPAVQTLSEWAWDSMRNYKYLLGEGVVDVWDPSIPRGWQMAASRKLVRERAQIVIRGAAHSIPNTRNLGDMDAFHQSILSGCDMATDVPIMRWDHKIYYDPEPEIYEKERLKTNVNHGCFAEGLDLFDNKFFSISPLESRVMDPVQRNTLENNYQALNQAGYTSKGEKDKTKLMQKYIGVYQGANTGEYQLTPHEVAGGCAGSEGSPAIIANRVSFMLGMMGPSYTMQTDAASALSAIYEGAFDVYPTTFKDKPMVDASACGGVYLMMTPFYWPLWNQWMDPIGRTCSFDQDSKGHVRADASGTVVLKRHGETVDGKWVFDDGVNILGTLSGWATTSNGRTANISAPHAHSLQVAVADSLRMAAIAPLDVDGVAMNANGLPLHDAVEVSAMSKILRKGTGGSQETLNMTAAIACVGWGQEANAMSEFLMAIEMTRRGCATGNIHLKAINPYIDTEESAVNISQDAIPYRTRTTFLGVNAFGFTGCNVHCLISNTVDEERSPSKAYEFDVKKKLTYWPAGGGKVNADEQAARGYAILGSWSSWETREVMKDEGGGVYSHIVTLGENRSEQFQILLDGDRSRILFPGEMKAGIGAAVLGPSPAAVAEGCNWMIDGSTKWVSSFKDGSDTPEWEEVNEPTTGVPGDTYKVVLRVAGKWKSVAWEKMPSVANPTVPLGHYSLAGDWNGWTLEDMNPEPERPGVHSLEVCLIHRGGQFQIIRNRDFSQVLYPTEGDASGSVDGPSEFAPNAYFHLRGKAGDIFRIEFTRKVDGTSDTKEVTWEKTGHNDPAIMRSIREKHMQHLAEQRALREHLEAEQLEDALG